MFFVLFHFSQKNVVNEKNPQLAEDFRAAVVNGDLDVIRNILDKGRTVFGRTKVGQYGIVIPVSFVKLL